MERDPTLATIADITEEEANITIPEVLPSSSGMSTSSSEYSNMAGRLLKYRSRGYRKRLSRSREEISASSRSRESAQTTATDDDENEASDADSLASNDVFGSKDDQISFFKQTLVDMNKKLEAYQEINADLSRKLENCKVENKGLKKQIQDILWDKYVLYDKYKKLKERFGIVDSPSGDDDSPGSNNSGPSGAGRVATPVRRPKKRGDSETGPRDGAGPSKRPTTVRCGLDRQMESDSNTSAEEKKELSDSGYYMDDISHSAKSCYESDADGSSSGSDSQSSLQSAFVDQDISNNPDNSNDAQSENDVPSHVSPSQSPDHVNEMNIFDDEVSKDGTVDLDIDDALHNYEDGDVCSKGSRRTSSSEDEQQVEGEERHEDNGSDASLQSEQVPNGGEVDTESDKSSERSSISRKRSRSSTSLSSEGESGGSKRRKSSSSSSTDCSGSTSRASSTSSDSVRRSPSRSPSPPDFADAPRIIPPVPDGSPEYPRYWMRNGNRTSLRSSVRVNYNDDAYFNFHLKGLI